MKSKTRLWLEISLSGQCQIRFISENVTNAFEVAVVGSRVPIKAKSTFDRDLISKLAVSY